MVVIVCGGAVCVCVCVCVCVLEGEGVCVCVLGGGTSFASKDASSTTVPLTVCVQQLEE